MSEPSSLYESVSSNVNFPAQEKVILDTWDAEKTFEQSLAATRDKPVYTFYDGPPFATGTPHYGHLLAGILKDIVPRYWTMRGRYVSRRFGWDCHGLPVEYEINKLHGLHGRKKVLEYGVGKYNAACRSIVTRYTNEWRHTVRRVGRWVDMDNAYYTLDPSFMQSVWWVFQQMWNKGLVYEDYKVVPYSVGISTPLSNFEANSNYKDVQDPALTVTFPVIGQENTFLLAWTTTPWTLPSNLALAVGPDLEYVRVLHTASGKRYLLAKARLESVFGPSSKAGIEVEATLTASDLVGLRYEPLFSFFSSHAETGAFRVITAPHVTTDAGTGIVHMAPAYGEEDFFACKTAGISLVNPVDDDGRFTDPVSDWKGVGVKDADPQIIAALKKMGRVFKHDTIMHSYPFCYRSDTPLIYRAVTSWFVKLDPIKERLLANNAKTRWVPDHLRDGRFGNWLANARDWAISRNRFWGTPLPVWKNREGESICIGSIDELYEKSGVRIGDLHLENVQDIKIPSPTGQSPLEHVGLVFDCWFESGSMPYAQSAYPFEGKDEFHKGFPAEFIAEGLDQTRGWFYTLSVIGTALFDTSPFRNVVVNGLVLAENGEKMSKSKRNYPEPDGVLDAHGADALRLCLIDSGLVRGQEMRFSETAVREVVRKILLRWWNAYSFFVTYAEIERFVPRGDFSASTNVLDQWVVSRLHTLIENTNREMEAYRLYNVVPPLLHFIEELTNTYVRLNRKAFQDDQSAERKRLAFETLYYVLSTMAVLLAPFTPFLAETIHRNLARVRPTAKTSVHLESYPEANTTLQKPSLERGVSRMEQLLVMGRNLREQIGVRVKTPLKTLTVIHRDATALEELRALESYFKDELNVYAVAYETKEDEWLEVTCKANFQRLGKRFGKRMKECADAIAKLSPRELEQLETSGTLNVLGESLSVEDIEVRRTAKNKEIVLAASSLVSIALDPTVTPEQQIEGLAREAIRKIQAARKNARLKFDDEIALELDAQGDVRKAIEQFEQRVRTETRAQSLTFMSTPTGTYTERAETDDEPFSIGLRVIGAAS